MKIKTLSRYLLFISRFGKAEGTRLFAQFMRNKTSNLKISKIKYDIFLRPKTSDLPVFLEIFVKEKYDIPLDFTPSIFIDAGANIGLTSVFFKNKYPGLKIIAIEPDAGNFSVLKRNTANYSDIQLIESGIWNTKIHTRIADNKVGNWALQLEETDTAEGSIETITIDEIMEQYDIKEIDILKIDIETAEKQLFSSNYSRWLPKTKVIIIELHDRVKKGCSQTFFNAITSTFKNYSFYQKGENSIVINEDIVK